MNKNLNKLTRAELIQKIENLDVPKIKNTEVSSKHKSIKSSVAILDIFNNIKKLIISLSITTILMHIFRKYKSIRAILKLANYIIITIFGISIFEAFGLGFIVKFLGELKYVFGAVITYLTNTTFYNYLIKLFDVNEHTQSVRETYKKPVEVDWKAEFDKAERQREIEKWKGKYDFQSKDDEKIDKTTIMLTLLFLVGSLGVWYYGKEALDIISPVWNIGNTITRILRGGRDDDANLPRTPADIELDPNNRAVSPDMLTYSSDQVEKKIVATFPAGHPARWDLPVAPPAPPAPPAPTAPTAQDEHSLHNVLLDRIKEGTKLKPTKTVIKDALKTGRVIEQDNTQASTSNITSSTEVGMLEQLKISFNKIRPMITGDDDLDDVKSGDNWDDTGEITPTNLLDKGKEVDRSAKTKFLEAIEHPGENLKTSKEFAPVLKSLKEVYPNLSDETLQKLSTREGLANRREIIASLSKDELKTDVTPLTDLPHLTEIIEKGKSLSSFKDLKKEYKIELERESLTLKPDELIKTFSGLPNFSQDSYLDEIITKNIDHSIEQMLERDPNLNKQQLIEKLIELNPLHKDLILGKVTGSIEKQIAHMEKIYSEKDFDKIKRVLTTEDLAEIQGLGENKTIDQIKTLKAINKSHNNLLEEIKRKSSKTSVIDDSTQKFNDTMDLFN
jgi:hypothetical protein